METYTLTIWIVDSTLVYGILALIGVVLIVKLIVLVVDVLPLM